MGAAEGGGASAILYFQFHHSHGVSMKARSTNEVFDGARCKVIGGVHAGKSGTVRDIKTGKTGHVSITVVRSNGVRFKTLAKNVVVLKT
jgi:ribosomal protein S4E